MKTVIQIEHEPKGMRQICNQYLSTYSQLGYKIVVVILKGKEPAELKKQLEVDELFCLNLNNRQLKFSKRSIARKLAKIISQHDVAFIVAHRFKASILANYAATLTNSKPPVFSVIHGVGQLQNWRRKIASKLMLKQGVHFIGVSEVVASDIKSALQPSEHHRVSVLHNSIDDKKFTANLLTRDKARQTLELNENGFVVGNIGRFSSSKDQISLVKSFATFNQSKPDSILVIIGEGHLRNQIEEEIQAQNMQNKIILTGEIQNAWRYLKAFDLFVTTSVDESFGLALLEAMLAKTPTVATDIPSYKEVLGESVSRPACGDCDAIAQAMQESMNGLNQVEKNFSRAIELFSTDGFTKNLEAITQPSQI
jgi:glycosyltransferase involved in cell wall biosynthesis